MSILDCLQRGTRDFPLPARLDLADGETLHCAQMLRLLPGKRAVMAARWRGRAALVKVILNTASGRRNLRRELAGHRLLKAAKITTPDLLFTARAGGSHVLAFAFIEHAQRLGDRWRAPDGDGNADERRREIAASILRLIARLHRSGCRHTDPHLDNFLLAPDGAGAGAGQLYVIDAASVERRAGWENGKYGEYGTWQRKNLARFFALFTPAGCAILRAALAENYPEAAADPRLEAAIQRAWRRGKARYLKKCFRECTAFATHKSWRRHAVWKRARQSDDLRSFLQDPDAWMARGEPLKDGNSATVVRVQLDGRAVVIKRNNIKNFRHRLRRGLRATRSRANWRNAHLLGINGIATPEAIAFVEHRRGPFRLRGYYVCADGGFPSAAEKYKSQPPSGEELARFAELLTALRLAGISHGDFKASNLLVTENGIALIDLDSVRECSPKRAAVLLRKDRRRFLENWKDKPEQLRLFSKVFGAGGLSNRS